MDLLLKKLEGLFDDINKGWNDDSFLYNAPYYTCGELTFTQHDADGGILEGPYTYVYKDFLINGEYVRARLKLNFNMLSQTFIDSFLLPQLEKTANRVLRVH